MPGSCQRLTTCLRARVRPCCAAQSLCSAEDDLLRPEFRAQMHALRVPLSTDLAPPAPRNFCCCHLAAGAGAGAGAGAAGAGAGACAGTTASDAAVAVRSESSRPPTPRRWRALRCRAPCSSPSPRATSPQVTLHVRRAAGLTHRWRARSQRRPGPVDQGRVDQRLRVRVPQQGSRAPLPSVSDALVARCPALTSRSGAAKLKASLDSFKEVARRLVRAPSLRTLHAAGNSRAGDCGC
eukprot:991613-Rhodomonas_salina.1